MKLKLLALLVLMSSGAFAQQEKHAEILPAEVQIKTALLAAPEGFRADATVLGYDPQGALVELKKGTNQYICLAPDYKTPENFGAFCYPKSLEPMMARGRELTAQGKGPQKDQIRAEEVKQGKLKMPQEPTIMYAYWGTLENLDKETGEMSDAKRRYVIYVSGASSGDLGLSNKPNDVGMPWLMDEGTYKAHIMISPPRDPK